MTNNSNDTTENNGSNDNVAENQNLENITENTESNDIKWSDKIKDNWNIVIFAVFILIFIILLVSGISPNYEHDKQTSDIIGLLVQSEAAIIAIVITLSLVAVQLAAQSYSTRVIEIFKKSYSFKAIISLYISAIITGISTLILADNGIGFIIQKLTLIDYYLGIVAVLALIPFIWTTFNQLKPSTILEELSKDIKKEKILDHISNKNENEDPIQPIIDILHSSCIKNDYNSFEKGLNLIHSSIVKIVNEDKLNQEDKLNEEKIINYVLDHYKNIGMVALANNDEKYITLVINVLYLVSIHSAEEKLENAENNGITILGDIGKIGASKFENATIEAANSIKNVLIMIINQNRYINPRNMSNLGYIGKIALEKKFDLVGDVILGIIESIITELFKIEIPKIAYLLNVSLLSLRMIGKTAFEQDLDLSIESVINVIDTIGKKSVAKYEMSTQMALFVLDDICMITLNKRLERSVVISIKSFESIGEEAISKKKDIIINEVLTSFYRIGTVALEQKVETSIKATLKSLESTVNNLIQLKKKDFALQAIHIFQKLDEIATKNQMEDINLIIENSYTTLLETAKRNGIKEVINILEKIKVSKTDDKESNITIYHF